MYTLVFLHCSKIGRRNVLPILSFCHGGRKCSRSEVYPRPPSSSCDFQYLLRLLWCLFTRWQILEGILCSVRRMPARASLLSQQRTMNCLKCAFSPQSQVSQGSKVWQPLAHNTHMHTHRYTYTYRLVLLFFSWGKIFVELCSVALQKFYVLNFRGKQFTCKF